MESRATFHAYLVTLFCYLIASFIFARIKKLPLVIVSISHAVPIVVAVLMINVFIVRGGATVSQFVGESGSGRDTWHLWFDLWLPLYFLTAGSSLVHLVWGIIACVKKTQRKWIPFVAAALFMTMFAFWTVGINFPDA